jgi:hypothetical protein
MEYEGQPVSQETLEHLELLNYCGCGVGLNLICNGIKNYFSLTQPDSTQEFDRQARPLQLVVDEAILMTTYV